MGGHGGLNILPQKKWNVYNFDNREKVRKDEEAAARDEQDKRDQSRKRDSQLRLEQLRRARGLDPDSTIGSTTSTSAVAAASVSASTPPVVKSIPEPLETPAINSKSDSDSKHINLFEGIKIFDPVEVKEKVREEGTKKKKMKKEEVRVVGPEDEKYRLGYGVAGKGVQAPWYTMNPATAKVEDENEDEDFERRNKRKLSKTKKTIEELREERLKREKTEKERERALLLQRNRPRSNSYYPRDLEKKQWW